MTSGQSCAICTEPFAPQDPALATTTTKGEALSETAQGKAKATDESNTNSGVAIELPCHHDFHDDCIIMWLKTSGTCPVCRYALVEQPAAHTAPGASGGGEEASPLTSPPLSASNRASNLTPATSAPAPPNPPTSTSFTTSSTSTSPTYPPPPSPPPPSPPPSRHQRPDPNSTSRSAHAQARQFFQATGGGPRQTLQNIFGGIGGFFHDTGAGLNGRRSGSSQSPARRNSTEGEGGSGFGFGFRRSHDAGPRDTSGSSRQQRQQRPNGGASGLGTRRHLPGGHEDLD